MHAWGGQAGGCRECCPLREGPAGARAIHDHVHGSRVVHRGEQESAGRGDSYRLKVDVTVCKVPPVILHVVVCPDIHTSGVKSHTTVDGLSFAHGGGVGLEIRGHPAHVRVS